jgi:hypothetical protein
MLIDAAYDVFAFWQHKSSISSLLYHINAFFSIGNEDFTTDVLAFPKGRSTSRRFLMVAILFHNEF